MIQTHRRPRLLREALESALAQTRLPDETSCAEERADLAARAPAPGALRRVRERLFGR